MRQLTRLAAVLLGAALLLGVANEALAFDQATAGIEDTTPFYVPVARRAELQHLLEQHRNIKLAANRDYRSSGLTGLLLASGERIEGGWNTRVPTLHVPGGSSSLFVAGVRNDASLGPDVVFEPGAESHDVTIIGGNGGIGSNIHVLVKDGARLDHVRLSEIGGIEVDQQHSGYIRHSEITRLLGYWPGPHVAWRGNQIEPSGDNVILGFSSITPARASHWTDAGDLSIFNWDCESWNQHDQDRSPCFVIEGSPHVTSVALSGGTADPDHAGAVLELSDVKAFQSWFFHAQGGHRDSADLLLHKVQSALMVQSDPAVRVVEQDLPAHAERQRLLDPAGAAPAPMQSSKASDDWSSVVNQKALRLQRDKPLLRSFPDPFPTGVPALEQMPDSARQIQADLDRDGLVRLPAGRYFLDRPLRIGSRNRTEGILGDPEGQVVLIAKGDFAIIEGRGDAHPSAQSEGSVVYLAFDHVMLYGGRYGFNWSNAAGNLGDGGGVAFSTFDHVIFAYQRLAGVNADGIHGLDTNTWYRTDFYHMPVAIRGNGHGSVGPMNYADKQSFLDCQFQDISDVVWYWTSDRAAGGESWVDCYFLNVGQLTRTRAANGLLWVNSVMENVTGAVAIQVTDRGSTSTNYFSQVDCLWRGRGPQVVTDTQSNGVGTLFVSTRFEQSGAGSLVAQRGAEKGAETGAQTLFAIDSSITGSTQLGHVTSGIFINSTLGQIDQPLEVIVGGVTTTLVGSAGQSQAREFK